jgi:hypothetical protein
LTVSDHYVVIKGRFASIFRAAIELTCDLRYVRLDNPPPTGVRKPVVENEMAQFSLLTVCVDVFANLRDLGSTDAPVVPPVDAESAAGRKAMVVGLVIIGVFLLVLLVAL